MSLVFYNVIILCSPVSRITRIKAKFKFLIAQNNQKNSNNICTYMHTSIVLYNYLYTIYLVLIYLVSAK